MRNSGSQPVENIEGWQQDAKKPPPLYPPAGDVLHWQHGRPDRRLAFGDRLPGRCVGVQVPALPREYPCRVSRGTPMHHTSLSAPTLSLSRAAGRIQRRRCPRLIHAAVRVQRADGRTGTTVQRPLGEGMGAVRAIGSAVSPSSTPLTAPPRGPGPSPPPRGETPRWPHRDQKRTKL